MDKMCIRDSRYYGLTASQTLQAAQELYEEKLVTYPRTDSQFVTEDMRKTDVYKRQAYQSGERLFSEYDQKTRFYNFSTINYKYFVGVFDC